MDFTLLSLKDRVPFLRVLSALYPGVEAMDQDTFREVYEDRMENGVTTIIGIVDGEIVCTASMTIERKYGHGGRAVAHIEDVAVRSDLQRKGYGKELMRYLMTMEECDNNYKIVLNCNDDNVGFYRSCGFRVHENGMRLDL